MRTIWIVSPLLSALLAGCWWFAPPNDAGEEVFAAQAIEAILGRKPRGAAEIRALAEIASTDGRSAVVTVLFEQPEFVSYWSGVLADDIEVQRAGAMQIDADCTAPALLPPSLSERLAEHLAHGDPSEPFCLWNTDTVELTFKESDFWDAFDAALSEYPFTTLDKLGEPEPLSKPVPSEPFEEPKFPLTPSSQPNLAAEGGTADNTNAYVDDSKGRVASSVDIKRHRALIDAAPFLDCPTFNLTDVIEAAVRADRLDALYRAYLPVFSTFPGTNSDSQMREQLGSMFLDVYLDRDPTCMNCHTATYSTTDARPLNNNWDRFDPVWYGLPLALDAEGTVFSHDLGGGDFMYGGDGGNIVRRTTGALFRRDNHTSNGIYPWGIDERCVTNPARGFDGFAVALPPDPFASQGAFAGVGPSTTVGVLDLAEALSDGTETLDQLALTWPDWAAYRAARGADPVDPPNPGCGLCHDPVAGSNPPVARRPGAPLLVDKVPYISDHRLFSIIRFGSGVMPAQIDSDAGAWNAVEWVRQNYPSSPALQMRDRNHAFVYMLSANIVNHIFDEITGENLIMAHGFSRNLDQARALSSFSRTMSLRFSLKEVLREIVLSEAFNRSPPEQPGTNPYLLPMLPYPEAEISPIVSAPPIGANANSEGDFVHKHSPAGLLHQVHHALGWPAPGIAGDPVIYPSGPLMTSLGRYTSRLRPEREHFNLDSFLTWETQVATCRKPEQARAGDVALVQGSSASQDEVVDPAQWVDWIDVLAEVTPSRGFSWHDLAIATKDRLLADPTLLPGEDALIAELWGMPALSGSPLDGDGIVTDDEKELLRDYCGVLLASPDFVLRGTRLAAALPDKGPAPVCMPNEHCDEDRLYADYFDIVLEFTQKPVASRK